MLDRTNERHHCRGDRPVYGPKLRPVGPVCLPGPNSLPPEDKHDARFAREYGDTALFCSASALRRFVSDPDTEALEQAGADTGNPDLVADVRDRRAERVVMEFKRHNPDYLPTNANFSTMVKTMAFNSTLLASEQRGDVNDVADRLILENRHALLDPLSMEGIRPSISQE